MNDYINRQVEARARAWGEAKALLDHAASEGRDLTAAESEQYDRINADLDERTAVIERLQKDEAREQRAAEIRVPEAPKPSSDHDVLRSLIRGEIRTATFERRQMTTSANGGLVPQGFYDVMQEQLRYTGPWGNEEVGYTILNTASGRGHQGSDADRVLDRVRLPLRLPRSRSVQPCHVVPDAAVPQVRHAAYGFS
jgi:uncharacterized protein YfaP (DUF2135 family)